jgi:hypothetical protein
VLLAFVTLTHHQQAQALGFLLSQFSSPFFRTRPARVRPAMSASAMRRPPTTDGIKKRNDFSHRRFSFLFFFST